MTHDPCLNCTLPDCDEDSPRCALRRAFQEVRRLRSKGQQLTSDQRQAAKAWAKRNDIEFYARRSETRDTQQEASFKGFFEG